MTEREKVSFLYVTLSKVLVETETAVIYHLFFISHFCIPEIKYGEIKLKTKRYGERLMAK